jgi:hypothetical protein
VADYIANQQAHHQKWSFEQEFVALLRARRVSNTIRDTCLDDSCAVPTGLGPPIYAYPALKGGAKIFRACGAHSLVVPAAMRTSYEASVVGTARLLR